jgi:hypothetical protein
MGNYTMWNRLDWVINTVTPLHSTQGGNKKPNRVEYKARRFHLQIKRSSKTNDDPMTTEDPKENRSHQTEKAAAMLDPSL